MATRNAELYDEGFYAWSGEQATAVRGLSAERWNGPLDVEYLAEEVEDLGDERRSAVRSQLRRLIEHCLKLELSPATEPPAAWLDTIDSAQAKDRLTPSIRGDTEAQLSRLYEQALRVARRALEQHGEREAMMVELPAECPYVLDQLLDEVSYPCPPARRRICKT
jgi:hypothetical protein